MWILYTWRLNWTARTTYGDRETESQLGKKWVSVVRQLRYLEVVSSNDRCLGIFFWYGNYPVANTVVQNWVIDGPNKYGWVISRSDSFHYYFIDTTFHYLFIITTQLFCLLLIAVMLQIQNLRIFSLLVYIWLELAVSTLISRSLSTVEQRERGVLADDDDAVIVQSIREKVYCCNRGSDIHYVRSLDHQLERTLSRDDDVCGLGEKLLKVES